jgi:hypothetical protein
MLLFFIEEYLWTFPFIPSEGRRGAFKRGGGENIVIYRHVGTTF